MDFLRKKLSKQQQQPTGYERYVFQNEVGSGNSSVVYKALDAVTGKNVAVKILPKFPVNQKQLLTEVEIMSKLKHKNIIQLYDVFETPDKICLVMEL